MKVLCNALNFNTNMGNIYFENLLQTESEILLNLL